MSIFRARERANLSSRQVTTWLTANQASSVSILFTAASSHFIDCGAGASMNITGDFTIAAWVKQNGINDEMIAAIDNSSGARKFTFGVNSGKIYFERAGIPTITTGEVSADVWHHLCVTFTGGNYNAYVDAINTQTVGGSALPSSTNKFFIGKREYSGYQAYWDGYISAVRMYGRALSGTEITALVNSRTEPATTNLVGWWKFDEGTNTTANDSSGNANTGTLTNGPTWSTVQP